MSKNDFERNLVHKTSRTLSLPKLTNNHEFPLEMAKYVRLSKKKERKKKEKLDVPYLQQLRVTKAKIQQNSLKK